MDSKIIEKINSDIMAIADIESPSEETQLMYIRRWGSEAVLYLDNPTDAVIKEALKDNISLFYEFNNLSDDVIKYAIDINPNCFFGVKNPSDEVFLYAIKKDYHLLRDLGELNPELQLKIIKINPFCFPLIKNPSVEAQILAIRRNIKAVFCVDTLDKDAERIFIEEFKKLGNDKKLEIYNKLYEKNCVLSEKIKNFVAVKRNR